MQPGLKSVSTTKLLYHVYTPDCVTNLLATMHFLNEGNESHVHTAAREQSRTVVAILTE